jgi:phosphatidylglycerol:prolipoprotein diacylglycerol transferase
VLLWKFFELKPRLRIGSAFALSWFARRSTPQPILPFCDVVLAVFPIAWVFGRAGCSVVHDHPGARASIDSVLAVAYGEGPSHSYGFFELRYGDAPRYDLGVLELLFTVFLALAFASTWRKRLPIGSYAVATALAYAPVRFGLDFMRIEDGAGGDPRYAGLTPAQWACLGLFATGFLLWWHVRARSTAGDPTADPARV